MMDLKEVQERFTFAWWHTEYRANLVALRSALGLRDKIHLPVDDQMTEIFQKAGIQK